MARTKKVVIALLISLFLVASFALASVNLGQAKVSGASNAVEFTDSFDYLGFEDQSVSTVFSSGIWSAESKANGAAQDNSQPVVEDGVMRLSKGMSAQLLWTKISGFSFDVNKTYTIKLDVKVTSFGDDSHAQAREVYIAPGGYYNQVELKSSQSANKVIRTGGTYCGNLNVEYTLNTTYGVELVWVPKTGTVTSTLKNGSTVVSTGSRVDTTNYVNANTYFSNWVFRCEDGAFEMDNFSFTDGTNTYTENFTTTPTAGYMSSEGIWTKGDMLRPSGNAPTVENGVVYLKTMENMEFHWQKITAYDSSKAYTFEFDFKVTNAGNGTTWQADACTRALFVSFGGWYNQIEMPMPDGRIRAGDTYATFGESVYVNAKLHAKVVLEGNMVSSFVFDESGNCVIFGSRTNTAYGSGTDTYMPHFALRCEDGAVEIDNFQFRAETFEKGASTALAITTNNCANYSADLNYNGTQRISVKLNSTEIMSISPDTGLVLGGSAVLGTYGAGKYGVKVMVNIEQKMVNMEITLPNGGIVRRGSYALVPTSATAYAIDVYAFSSDAVQNASVSYSSITKNSYEINETEPTYSGFNASVYNLVTSFNDAATTRNFAFTALTSFVNGGTMAVRYREKGATAWTVADAVKEVESTNSTEDYYKADVTGLKANTEYEYQIGIKGSASNWSKTYSFKTATGTEDEFSFIAVGDTQGITWNGRTGATKGFMFAQTAYNEAFAEVANAAFALHTGDVVENGGDVAQWNMYFKSLGEYGATIPSFATIGNHDTYNINTTTGENYFDLHFNHPNNGGSAVLDKTYTDKFTSSVLKALIKKIDETIYSFNYGDAHFVVLASGNYSSEDQYLLQAQRAWLEADLKANECAKWKIIMVHEPVYHRVGGTESRPWLYDVIENNGVDLVIQGHSHLVTRSYPMKDGKIVSKLNPDVVSQGIGTVYTTVGSTAYNHDGLGSPNVEEMLTIATPHSEQPSYATVKVSGNKLIMTVKQIDGLVLDSFEILADVEKADHAGTLSTQGAKDPTCGEEGYTGDKYCSLCGKIAEKGQVIPATEEHVYDCQDATEKYKKSGATCTEKAKYFFSCKCGAKGTEAFEYGEAKGHNYGEWISEEPAQVGKEGKLGHYHCQDCNTYFDEDYNVLNDLTIPALPQPETSSSEIISSSTIISSNVNSNQTSSDVSSKENTSQGSQAKPVGGCGGNISNTLLILLPLAIFAFITILKKSKN